MKKLFLLLFIIIACSDAFAQQIDPRASILRADAKPPTAEFGQEVQLRYRVSGKGQNFVPPTFDDFQVVSGPTRVEDTMWVNQYRIPTETYYFTVRPMAYGKLFIPSANLDFRGETVESNPLTITVNGDIFDRRGTIRMRITHDPTLTQR